MTSRRLNYVASISASVGIASVLFGVANVVIDGFGGAVVWTLASFGVALLMALVVVEVLRLRQFIDD